MHISGTLAGCSTSKMPWCPIKIPKSTTTNSDFKLLVVSYIYNLQHSALMSANAHSSGRVTTLQPFFRNVNQVHPPLLPMPTSSGCLASINGSINMSLGLIVSLVALILLPILSHLTCSYCDLNCSHPFLHSSPSQQPIRPGHHQTLLFLPLSLNFNANSWYMSLYRPCLQCCHCMRLLGCHHP